VEECVGKKQVVISSSLTAGFVCLRFLSGRHSGRQQPALDTKETSLFEMHRATLRQEVESKAKVGGPKERVPFDRERDIVARHTSLGAANRAAAKSSNVMSQFVFGNEQLLK